MTVTAEETRGVDGKPRTFLVTGATGGIGFVTARELARAGGHVVVTGRDAGRAEATAHALRAAAPGATLDALALDLADLSSVRACADAFKARGWPLHVLINNAGQAGARGLTKDGFELTIGVNHLGPFLLTNLLLPLLESHGPARVVNVASRAHRGAKRIDFGAWRTPSSKGTGIAEYGVSKLCNILFTRELARRLRGKAVTTYALHPGVVATDIWRRVPAPLAWVLKRFMLTADEGARTTLWCATAPALATESGRYYSKEREETPTAVAQDDELAARLWTESGRAVGLVP